jgi:hypothetical protein
MTLLEDAIGAYASIRERLEKAIAEEEELKDYARRNKSGLPDNYWLPRFRLERQLKVAAELVNQLSEGTL